MSIFSEDHWLYVAYVLSCARPVFDVPEDTLEELRVFWFAQFREQAKQWTNTVYAFGYGLNKSTGSDFDWSVFKERCGIPLHYQHPELPEPDEMIH